MCLMTKIEPKPFYGVDGNLLVADLHCWSHEAVNAILDGTFRPAFWAQQFAPMALFSQYPQLSGENAKRRHRRAYRAHLEAKRVKLRHSLPSP